MLVKIILLDDISGWKIGKYGVVHWSNMFIYAHPNAPNLLWLDDIIHREIEEKRSIPCIRGWPRWSLFWLKSSRKS